jgi:hypothetical protein
MTPKQRNFPGFFSCRCRPLKRPLIANGALTEEERPGRCTSGIAFCSLAHWNVESTLDQRIHSNLEAQIHSFGGADPLIRPEWTPRHP